MGGGGGGEEREHTYLSNQERAPPQDDKHPGTAHTLAGGDGAMIYTVCGRRSDTTQQTTASPATLDH